MLSARGIRPPENSNPTIPPTTTMRPTTILSLGLALVSLCLSACSSGPQVDPAITSAASSRGVSAATCSKMTNAQPLAYSDIQNLVSKGVPASTIVAYLTSTRKVYDFSYAQLAGLKSEGATPQLLNYLTETQGFYGNNAPKQKARLAKEQNDQYYNTPNYQNRQPFAYNEPIIDDWYDSAYEESLYSPFSFN
jgi:hypothetical protein